MYIKLGKRQLKANKWVETFDKKAAAEAILANIQDHTTPKLTESLEEQLTSHMIKELGLRTIEPKQFVNLLETSTSPNVKIDDSYKEDLYEYLQGIFLYKSSTYNI